MSELGVNLSRYLLRACIGGTMIAHGVRHGRTLEGTGRWFGSIGFRQPALQAAMSSAVEIGAGAAVLAGAATPVAASAVVGTMAVAGVSVHRENGFFVVSEGYEYVLFISAASVALAAMGAGPWSVDAALGLDRKLSGGKVAAAAALLGLAGATAQLAAFWRRPAPAPAGTATPAPAPAPAADEDETPARS
jgi:putative oxidoreductase